MKRCYVTPLCSLSQYLETGADSHLLWNKPTSLPQYVFHTICFPFSFFTQFVSHFHFSHNLFPISIFHTIYILYNFSPKSCPIKFFRTQFGANIHQLQNVFFFSHNLFHFFIFYTIHIPFIFCLIYFTNKISIKPSPVP